MNLPTRLAAALLWSAACTAALAQQVLRYDGGSGDTATAAATDGAGGVYVGGSVRSSQPVGFAVVKHDAAGAVRWVARFSGAASYSGGEVAAIAFDSARNQVCAAGRIERRLDSLTITFDAVVACFDAAQGTQRWARVFNGPADGHDLATRLVLDPQGALYVAGSVAQAPGNVADTRWFVQKYAAADGALLWSQTEGGPIAGPQAPVGAALDPLGRLVVLGVVRQTGGGFGDIGLVQYDAAGTVLWRRSHAAAPASDEVPAALAVGADGSAYVAAMVSPVGDPEGEFVPLLLRYDGAGTLQFAVSGDSAGGAAVAVAADGQLVVAGTAIGAAGSSLRASISSYDTAGSLRWTRRLFAGDTFAEGELVAAPDNTVYYGARVFLPSGFDYLALRFDAATGNERWRNATPAGNQARDAHLSAAGDFLLTGSTDGSPTDMLTVRYPANFAPPPPAAPAAPTALALKASRATLTLQWQDQSNNETAFEVERATGDGSFQRIATLPADTRSHVDGGLDRRQTYSYRVRAVNAVGASAYSNVASGRPR
jgi:outer membrane protein assembly factor BamB